MSAPNNNIERIIQLVQEGYYPTEETLNQYGILQLNNNIERLLLTLGITIANLPSKVIPTVSDFDQLPEGYRGLAIVADDPETADNSNVYLVDDTFKMPLVNTDKVSYSTIRNLPLKLVQSQKEFFMTDTNKSGWFESSDENLTDDGGTFFVSELGYKLKRKLDLHDYVRYEWFWETGSKTSAIQKACDLSSQIGKPLLINDKILDIEQTIFAKQKAKIVGGGVQQTTIRYSGNSICFRADRAGETIDIFNPNTFSDFTLKAVADATTSATAVGIQGGNWYGANLENLFIQDFAGEGIKLVNNRFWTEGTLINNVNLRYNKIGLSFRVEADSITNGFHSFCNTRALHLNIVTKTNQVGVHVGSNAHIYGSTLNIKGNFESDGTSNSNQIGILVDNALLDNNHYEILFEGGDYNALNECVSMKCINSAEVSGEGIIHHLGGYVNTIVDATSVVKLNCYTSNTFVGNFPTTKRVKLYTLKPTADTSNLEKLHIEIRGGLWTSTETAFTSYMVSSRGGLKVFQDNLHGKIDGHALKVYQNTDSSFDICIETTTQYTAFDIKCYLIDDYMMSELKLTSQNSSTVYDVTGKSDVTPQFIHRNYITFSPQSDSPSTPFNNEISIYSNVNGQFSWKGGDGYTRVIDTSAITGSQTWSFPNRGGLIEILNQKTTTINQDGVLQLVLGATIEGIYKLEYSSTSRKQYLIFQVTAHQYGDAYINILSDYAYNNQKIFTNLRVLGNTDGSSRGVVVDISNRITATDKATITGLSYSNIPSFAFSPTYSTVITNYIQKIGKSFVLDKKTTSQINALSNIEESTIIYDSSLKKLKFYNGTSWETVTSA